MSDITPPEVSDIAMAIIPEVTSENETEWHSYLINMKPVAIEGVLVSSSGYGLVEKEKVKTSQLRYFLDVVEAESFRKVELIPDELHGLTNQYWVSFFLDGVMFDKKYLFVPDSIKEENLTQVPLINQKGVLII